MAKTKKVDEQEVDVQTDIQSERPSKKTNAELQAEHKTLSWYDEFEVRIQKKVVRNVLASKNETIITGWELVKKLQPKFIEPSLAKYLNSFADGYVPENVGNFLVPKDEAKTGDIIPYKDWADAMGRNPKEDLNQVLG